MFSKEIFAERVKQSRRAVALTQQELGTLSGLSKQAINDIENGRRLTTLDKASALADALHVSLDWLSGREDTIPVCPSEFDCKEVAALLDQLSQTVDALRACVLD